MPRPPPPIVQDAYDLALAIYRAVPTFPKAQRFVLGQRIEHAALDVLFELLAANDPALRPAALAKASRGLDQLRLLLRLAFDLHFLPLDRHEAMSTRVNTVGRQLGGWRKWAQR